MGKIQIDHTGSGAGITLSSDGTSLLVGGTAVGGTGDISFSTNEISTTDDHMLFKVDTDNNETGYEGYYFYGGPTTNGNVRLWVNGTWETGIKLTSSSTASSAILQRQDKTMIILNEAGQNAPVQFWNYGNGSASHIDLGLRHADARVRITDHNSSTVFYSLPRATPSSGQVLTASDGSGTLAWSAPSGPDLYGANPSSATDPTASGANAVAIGDDAVASGVASVALGQQTDATGTNAIAIGSGAQATQPHAVAIRGTASARESTAIGVNNIANGAVAAGEGSMSLQGSYASGTDSFAAAIANNTSSYGALGANTIAMGQRAKASDGVSIAIGQDVTSANGSVAIGLDNTASATGTAAFGNNANAVGVRAVALTYSNAGGTDSFAAAIGQSGNSRGAQAAQAVAIGNNAYVQGTAAIGLGYYATIGSSGTRAVALGHSYANGNDSFAAVIDNNTNTYGAQGDHSIAMGYNCKTTAQGAVSIGFEGTATANYAVALGQSNASGQHGFAAGINAVGSSYGAIGSNSVALGRNAKATSADSLAFGRTTQATTSYATAIGYNCLASGTYGVALGYQAQATGNNSIAAGASSTYQERANATAHGAVALGGAYANGTDSVAIGASAKSTQIGKISFSNDNFSAVGDSQGGLFILRADTTDATATVLTTNNSTAAATNQIVAASDTCITFDGTITAMQNGAQAYASWRIEGLLVNDGGTTTLANSATTVIDNQSSWVMALSADNTNNALAITCTGEASHNIRWVANIRTTEVTYA